MSYQFYKVLHLSSLFLLFLSLGAHALFFALTTKEENKGIYRGIIISHGVSLVVALVAGFGLLARLGLISGWPGWVFGKLVIWVLFGGILVFNKKSSLPWHTKTLVMLLLGVAASFLAVNKPF